jgi:hypothetical protein
MSCPSQLVSTKLTAFYASANSLTNQNDTTVTFLSMANNKEEIRNLLFDALIFPSSIWSSFVVDPF